MHLAYYNEFDPYVAEWLRNLIAAGHIMPGIVDDRSIEDVRPADLAGFTQWHFFAGIGVWSRALRRAGWPDSRQVATASCPCQPFSAAGKGDGFADERHLWPAFYHLVEQCRFPTILGEQVASKDADPWIDLVQADLEAVDYAFGCVPFPSAGVGAPHIRDRLYWVAHADGAGLEGRGRARERAAQRAIGAGDMAGIVADTSIGGRREERTHAGWGAAGDRAEGVAAGSLHGCGDGRMADAPSHGRQRRRPGETSDGRNAARLQPERLRDAGGLAHAILQQRSDGQPAVRYVDGARGRIEGAAEVAGLRGDLRAGPTNGHWRAADWLLCRDGRWRPVEPGYEQMADGSAGSLGRVRSSDVEEITEEINAWSIRHQADAGEALRRVWADLQSKALCEREAGRFSGVQSPAVLLAFMRQLTEQGWRFSDALAREGAAAPQVVVRVLRFDPSAARTPLRRKLAEQLDGELADPLQDLSSILAHQTAECWGDACRAKAGAASFPLSNGAAARVGRLRAYGNAVNAEAAQEWIECVMECMP